MKYVLAYDLGTSGTKAVLYDETGIAISSAYRTYMTSYPRNGYHEQSPADWWQSVAAASREIIQAAAVDPQDILCLALSGHSLGAVPIGWQGELLADQVPIWSDSRAFKQAGQFFQNIGEAGWYMTTGNGFPAHLYAVFKMMWFRDNYPDLYAKTRVFLGTKDYVNFKLTGVVATDHSYASGSGVYDLLQRGYRADYIAASGLRDDLLPPIGESSDVIGRILPEAATLLGLSENTSVVCGGVDNSCMALGAGCIAEGNSYTSLGSSSWIAVTSRQPVLQEKTRPYVFAHCLPGMYVSATCIFASGSAWKWARDALAADLADEARQTGRDVYDLMTQMAGKSPAGANKLIFNPSLAGGSSIEGSPNIRGAFIGLNLGHDRSDLLRAVLEGIALNLRLALDALHSCTQLNDRMLIVGGGGKSSLWRQIFADVYNLEIIKTNIEQDAGALGAAALALAGCGIWSGYSRIPQLHQLQQVHLPDAGRNRVYEQMLPVFRRIGDLLSEAGELMIKL